ncbi:MAG: hypothetical protein AAGE01_00455 [Pseudomonadota bacterium]
MATVALLPVVFSCLLLAAHFLRARHTVLTPACVALPLLLLLRERRVPRVFQVVLLLGCLEWMRTLIAAAIDRSDASEPWGRLAVILSAVAAFTAASALVFRLRGVRRRFDEQP